MIRLYIHDKCLEQLFTFPKTVQKKVLEFQSKFRQNSKSSAIHLEPIHDFKDKQLRTARIDEKYRAIVRAPQSGSDYFLLWVDNHDEAMDWARTKTFVWNENTHAAQIFETPVINETVATPVLAEEKLLFSVFTDEQLAGIGVPEQLLPLVRSLKDIDELGQAEKFLPADAFENLFYLADGANIHTLLLEIKEGAENDAGSINNRRSFVVAEDKVLEEYLNGELSKWQVFLHPTQRKLVEADFKGPVKVTGGAGTGKTVVALHRLNKLTNSGSDNRPVLFTTYTTALTENLKELVQKIQVPEGRYMLRNIDALVRELAQQYGIAPTNPRILDMHGARKAVDVWNEVLELQLTEFDAVFLNQEYQQVWLYHGIKEAEQYFKVSRLGRGKPLSRKSKMNVAESIKAYEGYKKEHSLMDRAELFNRVTAHLQTLEEKPFAAVIADEIQDMSNVELRFLRALTEEGDNDLFLVGDPYQKIYDRKINFSAAGIHVRGNRSKRLRINYRTTEEIKRLAISTVNEKHYDDFDGTKESMAGYLSLFHGERPSYQLFRTESDETAYIVKEIEKRMQAGFALPEIVIGCRKKEQLRQIRSALHIAGVAYFDLSDKTGSKQGVRLSTFHSLKGLEFKTVFLAGVNQQTAPLIVPGYSEWDNSEKEAYLQAERSLLYVAMTRAVQELVITGYGVQSELVRTK